MKWHGLHIGLAIVAVFIIGLATGIVIKSAHGADLPIPKRSERMGRPQQAQMAIGKTPLPEEPSACTKQLQEMKLCR